MKKSLKGFMRKQRVKEMILDSLKEYALPKEDDERIKEVQRMLKSFDWDGMEALICGSGQKRRDDANGKG